MNRSEFKAGMGHVVAGMRARIGRAMTRAAVAVMPKAHASAYGGGQFIQARYDAAQMGRRLGNWTPGVEGVNTLLFYDGNYLRTRSRDIVRQNAWAANGLDALVSNMVGTGIRPRFDHEDPAFKVKVQKLWHHWTEVADAAGIQGFYGLQALVARSMIEGGECFIRLRNRKLTDKNIVPLQLQVLEAEFCPLNWNLIQPNGNRVISGIEFDAFGRRVAYHLYRIHPGELMNFGSVFNVPLRVPADEIIHVFRPKRPGQNRGEPWLTQALVKLHDLDKYDDAELVRKQTAALMAGFITKPAPEYSTTGEDLDKVNDDGQVDVNWSPGTMQVLLPGEDVKFSEPADVGPNYGEFMRTQLRAVAAAMGVTYEQLTNDLTGVNYSSIRAGLLEFRRRMEQHQRSLIIHQMCRPIFTRWMDQAVLAGNLTIPDYNENRVTYHDCKWIPQGWTWVDPQKEVASTVMAVRAGLMSRDQAVAANGMDAETMDREIAMGNERADELGLIFDSDARLRSRTGMAPFGRDYGGGNIEEEEKTPGPDGEGLDGDEPIDDTSDQPYG